MTKEKAGFFKNIKNKIEMKFLDVILAKVFEIFKTRFPKVYAIVALTATGLHVMATSWINNYEVFVATNPDMLNHVEAFAGVNPVLSQVVYYISLGLMALGGTHTTAYLVDKGNVPVKK